MPMLTTVAMGFPVAPVHAPLRTSTLKAAMRLSTSCTAGTTFSPSTSMSAPEGARSAVCNTARCSVTLIFSPANMASRRASTSAASATERNAARTVSSIRFLE